VWYGKDIVAHARHQIRYKWVRTPECRIHPETSKCHCRQEFFDTHALTRWMDAKEDGSSDSNAKRLVDEIDLIKPNFFEKSILQGESRSVLVLSCLLLRNCEELLYLFCDAGITDKALGSTNTFYGTLKNSFKKYALHRYSSSAINRIIQEFEEDQWAFCPAQIHGDLSKEQQFKTQTRLPFFDLTKINDKGGTACVIKVSVQENFVSEEMRNRLGPASHQHPDYGKVSQLPGL
jgi:hypothetical protein